eukprot:9190084-Pyramimonas_sp.AAC.1
MVNTWVVPLDSHDGRDFHDVHLAFWEIPVLVTDRRAGITYPAIAVKTASARGAPGRQLHPESAPYVVGEHSSPPGRRCGCSQA